MTADTGHVTDPVPLCQLLWRRARSDCGAESSLFGPGWCLVQGGERSERNASRAEEFGATSSGHTVLLQEWISKLSSQGTTRHRRTRVVDLDSQGSLQLRRVSPGAPGRRGGRTDAAAQRGVLAGRAGRRLRSPVRTTGASSFPRSPSWVSSFIEDLRL